MVNLLQDETAGKDSCLRWGFFWTASGSVDRHIARRHIIQQSMPYFPPPQELDLPPQMRTDPPDSKPALYISNLPLGHEEARVRRHHLIEAEGPAGRSGRSASGIVGLDGEAGDGPSDARHVVWELGSGAAVAS